MDVSIISYGGSSLAKFYGDDINQQSVEAIRNAIKSGVNYIDTSPWYGESEVLLGEAFAEVPRKTYYIGTKAGRNFTPGWENRFDFSTSAVLKNVENSLERLRLSYLDIIQIHDVEFCLDQQIIIDQTLPALESVVTAGKAKHIGITGYCLKTMKDIIERSPVKIDTILSYSRLNFNDRSLVDYISYFESKNIGVINAAPLSMGLFTAKGPPDWHPASDDVKDVTKQAKSFVESHGKDIEEVALGFAIHNEHHSSITTTLVSMPNDDILKYNLDVATTQRIPEDRKLYTDVLQLFEKKLSKPGHWEGKELDEYRKSIASCHKPI